MAETTTLDAAPAVTFAQMGFSSAVTAKSATPATDGYDGTFQGLPYHIDPKETPDAYSALVVAIAANLVTVTAYIAPTVTLAEAQTLQSSAIDAAYDAAIAVNVSFTTAAGIVQTYQADPDSQSLLLQNTQAYTLANAVPTGFYWRAADNTQVSFTLPDLQGLNAAVIAQDWSAFQIRSTRKDAIAAATTVADVQAITWKPAVATATSTTSTPSST